MECLVKMGDKEFTFGFIVGVIIALLFIGFIYLAISSGQERCPDNICPSCDDPVSYTDTKDLVLKYNQSELDIWDMEGNKAEMISSYIINSGYIMDFEFRPKETGILCVGEFGEGYEGTDIVDIAVSENLGNAEVHASQCLYAFNITETDGRYYFRVIFAYSFNDDNENLDVRILKEIEIAK